MSFVIGTAWEGVDAGARVYFVYNNPDEILRQHVERSREIIEDPRIDKLNLTTGPMAIAGSTRMQATSIQLCVLLTVLEMVVRDLLGLPSAEVPRQFLEKLAEMLAGSNHPRCWHNWPDSLRSKDPFIAAPARSIILPTGSALMS